MRGATITIQRADFVGVTLVGGGPGDADLITVAWLKGLLVAMSPSRTGLPRMNYSPTCHRRSS
jgi:hypothetical protein